MTLSNLITEQLPKLKQGYTYQVDKSMGFITIVTADEKSINHAKPQTDKFGNKYYADASSFMVELKPAIQMDTLINKFKLTKYLSKDDTAIDPFMENHD